jgi:MoaA/NifB/PqqE/SkfB family radical SAM enzyme
MKAKFKPRIDLENRTRLETVIPLKTPFVIFVDPSDACNFKCKFCPTGDPKLMKSVGRSLKLMDFDLFKKVVDDICEFDEPIKVLRLYKDGEPLLNLRLPEMIRYAKDRGCCDRVDTTTNASLLNPEKSLQLVEAGLDRINISIEGVNAEQYWDFSGYKINFPKLVENIAFLYENRKQCEMIVKINGDTLTEEQKQQFINLFGDIADGIYIEHIMSCWPEFELRDVKPNKDFGIYGQPIQEVMVCPYPFYSFSINSEGTVSLCFLDWSRKLLIGDVRNEKVKDIWFGDKLRDYQIMFLRNLRKQHPVCGNCGQMSHGRPDNIDAYADELLDRLGSH